MAVIQTFNHSEKIVIQLLPSNGNRIVEIFDANPRRLTQRLGLTAQYTTVNSFIKTFDLYTEINSCEEVEMPNFELQDSSTDKVKKAIETTWNSPRKEMTVWDSVNGGPWRKVCIVALHNPGGYPYRTYHIKDELTDSLYYEAGTGYKLGVSIDDVGFGGLTDSDIAVIRISGTSEVVVINPSTEVFKDILVNKSNAVTDENIGPRVIDDKRFGGTEPNLTLTTALSSLAHQIKRITGKDTWREEPVATLEEIQSAIARLNNDVLTLIEEVAFEADLGRLLNTEWQNLNLTSNWVNCADFQTYPPQFRILKNGNVEVRGAIKALQSPSYFELIATIPVEARPGANVFLQATTGATPSQLTVDPNGNIYYQSGDALIGILLEGQFAAGE